MTDSVAVPSKHHTRQSKVWHLVDTLWGGTFAMRDAAKEYLPQEPAEDEAAYFNRLKRSVLTPYYPDVIKKLMGKILKKPVAVEDDVPEAVSRFLPDVDSNGTALNEFVRQVGIAALNHGVTYILVDSPNFQTREERTGQPITRQSEVRGELRPYAIHVKAPQVLGWKSEVTDGQKILTQVRILFETEEDGEDEFEQICVPRIHVWEIGLLRIYRLEERDGQKEWVLEQTLTVELDFIPLIAVYSEQTDFLTGCPPLMDVAHLNITHWQSDSDQRNILHVARVPMLFGSGLGDDERGDFQVQVGPNRMIRGPQGSKLEFVEHTGKGIDAGAKDLDTIAERIAKLGLNMLIRRQPGDVTATSRALDQSEADSPLGMFARQLEDKIGDMLNLFALYQGLGEKAGGSVNVFKDFSISQRDAEDLKALGDARSRGDISQKTYWDELRRRGVLHDEFSADDEIDLLELEFEQGQERMENEMQRMAQFENEDEDEDNGPGNNSESE